MTNRDHDTDPSTPGAKRPPEGRANSLAPVGLEDDPGLRAARLRPTTDPGIAPEAGLLPVPDEPMGIVVPSVAAKPDDSVDILLEGISGEQPERPRATPQAEGQAVAAYHAQHAVAPGHKARIAEPKVVIARPVLTETVRVERSTLSPGLPSVIGEPKASAEATAMTPEPMALRVFIALGAGIAVVIGIFLALHRGSNSQPIGVAPASARGSAATGASAAASAPPVFDSPRAVSARETKAAATAPQASADNAPPPAANLTAVDGPAPTRKAAASQKSPTPPRTRARPATSPSKPADADLGEFKASF